ncbi:MAG: cell division protein ZapE [bacterium]
MNLSPEQRYQRDLESGDFVSDDSQRKAVQALQSLYDALLEGAPRQPSILKKILNSPAKRKREPVKGLYFWGGVGRGKTYLMDNFFESLPFDEKLRAHFHRFMRSVHNYLTELAGEKNPLDIAADRIAERTRVLCFDEFFVTDITDAMILGTLLEKLFDRGVTLVATSNIEPKYLYKDGLQRQRFLPAIDMLYRHTDIINVDGGVDYRLRTLTHVELYHFPLDDGADKSLSESFRQLAPAEGEIEEPASLELLGRELPVRMLCEDVLWIDYAVICDGPRSQNDYIEIAREFHAVLVSSVEQMGEGRDDQARRFINMVDEFYDRGVKLIISAAVPMDELYSGGKLTFEFQRTLSRLQEMQSREYLARPHKP